MSSGRWVTDPSQTKKAKIARESYGERALNLGERDLEAGAPPRMCMSCGQRRPMQGFQTCRKCGKR